MIKKSYNKILASIVVIFVLFSELERIPVVWAADDSFFSGGSGTENDPYQIRTKEQLISFQNSVNTGEKYTNQFIEIIEDIDLNTSNSDEDYLQWSDDVAPDTVWDGISGFAGHFSLY